MKTLIVFFVAAQLFSSCFGTKPIKELHEGELTDTDSKLSEMDARNDNSYFDPYEFEAAEGMVISAYMKSDNVDPYLHLMGPTGDRLEDHDDLADDDNNARIRCLAPVAGKYKVIANSYAEDETGAYILELETSKATDADASLGVCGGAAAAGGAAPTPDSEGGGGVEVVE